MASIFGDTIILTGSDISASTPIKDETGAPVKLNQNDIIRWVDTGGAAADVATIVHGKGGVLFASCAVGANWTDREWVNKDINDGVYLTALTHGTIYIIRGGGRIR